MAWIKHSVGYKAYNFRDDVQAVQIFLNNFILFHKLQWSKTALLVDGKCGDKTERAIFEFQYTIVGMDRPDAKVSPSGPTIKALAGPIVSGRSMPRPPWLGGNDSAQMFQQIMQQLTQGQGQG
jgi:hypothetical protein